MEEGNPNAPKRIMVLFAHPAFEKSRANKALRSSVEGMEGVTFRDLYEIYPRFDIDVAHEQQLLREHDVVILQHPFFWYNCPALMKEWMDLVLQYNFAYGPQGTALKGKWLMSAITTGGGAGAYHRGGHNWFSITELLTPFEQTARLCGMRYLPPFVLFDAIFHSRKNTLPDFGASYRRALESVREGKIPQLDENAELSRLWGQPEITA